MNLISVHAWRINDDSDQAGSAQDKLIIDVEESRFACFSVAVSYDGSYALAGANDGCIYMYDRHSDKRTLRVSRVRNADHSKGIALIFSFCSYKLTRKILTLSDSVVTVMTSFSVAVTTV